MAAPRLVTRRSLGSDGALRCRDCGSCWWAILGSNEYAWPFKELPLFG